MRLHNELTEILLLDGEWSFRLAGETQDTLIQVPGCWEAQGHSKWVEGPALYRRWVRIPDGWQGKRIQIEFDAVSYACIVRVDGREAGRHRGLWTPFSLDLTGILLPGSTHELSLEVWKPGDTYPMRSSLAGFLPDVATTFGGIWQPVRLSALDVAFSEVNIRALADEDRLSVACRAEWFGRTPSAPLWRVEAFAPDGTPFPPLEAPDCCGLDLSVFPGRIRHWSPQDPALYRVRVTLFDEGRPVSRVERKVGFRRLSAQGDRLLLNGRPVMLRGILSWGWEPERIAPVYSPDQAREEIRRVRGHGFNLVKHCLFVPNPEYFQVADEEGMLIWVELPMWLPEVTGDLRAQAPLEYAQIAEMTAVHPSVVLYSLGCELSNAVDEDLLAALDGAVRPVVSGALMCDNSGSGESYGGFDADRADFSDYHPYFDLHYFEPLLDNWRRDWLPTRPWIFGEFCDADTFRDRSQLVAAFGGTPPWWLTADNPVCAWRSESKALLEAGQRLQEANLAFGVDELEQAALGRALVMRRYTLETLRRRAGLGGYVVTGLRDTPISTSGIWDDFGQPKWPAADFLTINGEAVLSLDTTRRRVWRHGGDRPDRLDAHCFRAGSRVAWRIILNSSSVPAPQGSRLTWRLVDESGRAVQSGEVATARFIEPGRPGEAASISVDLPALNQAQMWTLEAGLEMGNLRVSNRWPVWVFPAHPPLGEGLWVYDPGGALDGMGVELDSISRAPIDGGVLITPALDEPVKTFLRTGGRVLLLQNGLAPLPAQRCPFWREGIPLFADHPIWQAFPQRGYADLQFFGVAGDTAFLTEQAADQEGLEDVRPILRRLDAREFRVSDYLFEARLGAGRLLACALRPQGGMGVQPSGLERNVAGDALLQAMLDVLRSAG